MRGPAFLAHLAEWTVYLSVCVFVCHNGVPNKMAEPIKGPFTLWTIICGGSGFLRETLYSLILRRAQSCQQSMKFSTIFASGNQSAIGLAILFFFYRERNP